jgi:hypothetical protein
MSWHLRAWFAGFVTVAAMAGPSASTLAETVRLDIRTVDGRQVSQLVYRAAPGERNEPRVSYQSPAGQTSGPITDYWVTGTLSETAPGRGCSVTTYLGSANTAIRCPIPDGVSPGGAVVYLGDRNDYAVGDVVPGSAALSMHLLVYGGPGDDRVAGSGTLNGGPGSDEINGSGRLDGGPGSDEMNGSSKRDVILARDGSLDLISCKAGTDTAILDALDAAGWWIYRPLRDCEQVRRRGTARAVPVDVRGYSDSFYGEGWGVSIACPPDGPAVCRGDVTVSRRGRIIRYDQFRAKRGHTSDPFDWATTLRFLNRLEGKRVWARVRTYDRRGRLQTVSLPFNFRVEREDVGYDSATPSTPTNPANRALAVRLTPALPWRSRRVATSRRTLGGRPRQAPAPSVVP